MVLNNEKKLGPTPKSTGVEQEFQQIAKTEESSLLQELACTRNGISDEEREERLEKYGYNDLSAMQKHSWAYFLVHSFADAFIIVLLVFSDCDFCCGVGYLIWNNYSCTGMYECGNSFLPRLWFLP